MLWKILHVGNAGPLEKVGSCEERSWDKKESLKQGRWPSLNTCWSPPSQSSSREMPRHWTKVCSTQIGMSVGCGLSFVHLAAFFVLSLQLWPAGCKLESWHPGHCKTPNYNSTESLPRVLIWSLIFIFFLILHSLSLLDYEIWLCLFFFKVPCCNICDFSMARDTDALAFPV